MQEQKILFPYHPDMPQPLVQVMCLLQLSAAITQDQVWLLLLVCWLVQLWWVENQRVPSNGLEAVIRQAG